MNVPKGTCARSVSITKKMDRQAVDPSLWGRHAWAFLDFVTAGYPDVAMISEQMAMTGFIEGLGFALPCERCRVNFKRFAAARPPGLAVAVPNGGADPGVQGGP